VVRAFDFVQVMSGGVGATVTDVPWMGLTVAVTIGALLLAWAFRQSARRDY
jgi:hypothetical protein